MIVTARVKEGRRALFLLYIYIYIMYTEGEPRKTPLVGRARRASFYTPLRNCGGRVIFRFVHTIRPKKRNIIVPFR